MPILTIIFHNGRQINQTENHLQLQPTVGYNSEKFRVLFQREFPSFRSFKFRFCSIHAKSSLAAETVGIISLPAST